MKKIISYSVAVFMGAATLFSCRERDVVAPTVVQQSNTPNGTRSYNFAMIVSPASTKGKTEALSGVSVTISQGQAVQTQTTNADGYVNFTGLNEGNIAWSIAAPSTAGINFAAVSGVKTLAVGATSFNSPNQSNQVGGVADIVVLSAKSATLSGKLIGNFDFSSATNLAGTAGVQVRLTYNISSSYRLEPNFYVTTTDANGDFTFANVPALDNLDINATLTAELNTSNAGQTVKFTLASTDLNSNELGNEKVFNMGTKILGVEGISNSSVTGVLYGDFTFQTTSNGGTLTFGPAVTNTDYVNKATVAGQALSTIPGFASLGFLRSGILVKLTYNVPSSVTGFSGPKEFTTTCDGTGRYTFTNVPATGNGVTATVSASVQLPKNNPSTGVGVQETFSVEAGVTVEAEQIKDFGPQELTLPNN